MFLKFKAARSCYVFWEMKLRFSFQCKPLEDKLKEWFPNEAETPNSSFHEEEAQALIDSCVESQTARNRLSWRSSSQFLMIPILNCAKIIQ